MMEQNSQADSVVEDWHLCSWTSHVRALGAVALVFFWPDLVIEARQPELVWLWKGSLFCPSQRKMFQLFFFVF